VASLLVSLVVLVFIGVQRDLESLSSQIVLTVFMESGTSLKDLATATSDLKTIAGIDSIRVQSATEIKETFVSRYATNIGAVLPENAFPTALIVSLREDYRTKERIDSVVTQALGMQSVDNVSYRTAFVEAVEARQHQERVAMWVSAVICSLVVIVLIWQSLYRLPLRLQESAGAVLAGVLVALFIGIAIFANSKSYSAWLSAAGVAFFVKVQLLGSVSVCAFATVVLAVNTVQTARHHDDETPPTSPSPGNGE
jgi:putative Mn2+ efflux pump MntP